MTAVKSEIAFEHGLCNFVEIEHSAALISDHDCLQTNNLRKQIKVVLI